MTIKELNSKLQTDVNDTSYADNQLVFGDGTTTPKLVMIGEAPGGSEVETGKPFSGKAGKNLTHFLETLNLKRDDIYITNVVKLRPTKISPKTNDDINRPPTLKEISFFKPYLFEELNLLNPDIIVTLGNVPLKVFEPKKNIGEIHGCLFKFENFNIFPLYHPAAIIYNVKLKDIYNDDLLKLKNIL